MQEVAEKIARVFKDYDVGVYPNVSKVRPRKAELDRLKIENYKRASYGSSGANFGDESHPSHAIALIISKVKQRSDAPSATGPGAGVLKKLSRRDITPVPISGMQRTELAEALTKLGGLLRRYNLRLDYLIHDEANYALVSITRGAWHGTRLGWFGHRNKFVGLLKAQLSEGREK